MNKDKVIFWVATGLLCAIMTFSGINYFINQGMKDVFVHLGFPSYFREELGIAKLLGVLALLIPAVPAKVNGFAYSGFAIVLISAIVAHSATDGISTAVMPIVFLVILGISYFYYDKQSAA